MEHWTRIEYQALALAVTIRSVARAGDDGWKHQLKTRHDFQPHNQDPPSSSLPPTPWWFIGIIAAMAVCFLIACLAGCYWRHRRRHMMMAHQIWAPPPMAPVMSSARMYGSLGRQPPVPRVMSSSLAPCPPQQGWNPPQATPYSPVPLYSAPNVDSFQSPSAPTPQPELVAPPPYNSQPIYMQ